MTRNMEDEQPILRKDTVYQQISKSGWVDVHELTVHIRQGPKGVTVEIWPIADDGLGSSKPLATCSAEYDERFMPFRRRRRAAELEAAKK